MARGRGHTGAAPDVVWNQFLSWLRFTVALWLPDGRDSVTLRFQSVPTERNRDWLDPGRKGERDSKPGRLGLSSKSGVVFLQPCF